MRSGACCGTSRVGKEDPARETVSPRVRRVGWDDVGRSDGAPGDGLGHMMIWPVLKL